MSRRGRALQSCSRTDSSLWVLLSCELVPSLRHQRIEVANYDVERRYAVWTFTVSSLIGRQWDGGECRFWEVLLFIWQWNCCCERGMMCMPSLLHRSASHYVVYERADCFRQAVNSDSRAGDSDSASRSIQNWSCLVYLYCVSTFSIERTLAKHTYFHRLSASRKLGKFDTGCRGVKPHLQERC